MYSLRLHQQVCQLINLLCNRQKSVNLALQGSTQPEKISEQFDHLTR